MTLTKEKRDSLSPHEALNMLKEGNNRFVTNLKVNRNLLKQANETIDGQHPFAFILSCIDSRTSAELIFDQGLGDILSCRIAGNVLNEDILGSMEFATQISGVKLIMVLGHSDCGAIKGACNNVKMGHFTGLLKKIRAVINDLGDSVPDEQSSEYLELISQENVKNVLRQIPQKSVIVNNLIKEQKIILVGAMYDLSSGKVDFY